MSNATPPGPSSPRDPYRLVVALVCAAAVVGTVAALVGGAATSVPALFDLASSFGLAAAALAGVSWVQGNRAPGAAPRAAKPKPATKPKAAPAPGQEAPTEPAKPGDTAEPIGPQSWIVAGSVGVVLIPAVLSSTLGVSPPSGGSALGWGIACLVAAGLSFTTAHYFDGSADPRLPEAKPLGRGARVLGWIALLAALSVLLAWGDKPQAVRVIHYALLALNAGITFGLVEPLVRTSSKIEGVFPLDLGIVSALGGRPNVLASILDAAESQIGIDLRSTWALTVIRRGIEPLLIGLAILGWLSTSLTAISFDEEGLVEHWGVPDAGPPLSPGLHVHWPWPVDKVFRVPVARVQTLTVGHEGAEEGGPENVLWAVEHAPNEYTLVLGNGRDLITIDAAVQYRIVDARAWRYNATNPEEALKAIAYRAVMRNTVNRTLEEALSENVAALTNRMKSMVQSDADALGLGVHVEAFTVGGMHPPVMVASDYQAVVSAELGKVTAVINAETMKNQKVQKAEASVLSDANAARADAASTRAVAAGEAWAFRTLESQVKVAPADYWFRRRLEALEGGLADKTFTVLDARIERDGGEIWLTR